MNQNTDDKNLSNGVKILALIIGLLIAGLLLMGFFGGLAMTVVFAVRGQIGKMIISLGISILSFFIKNIIHNMDEIKLILNEDLK